MKCLTRLAVLGVVGLAAVAHAGLTLSDLGDTYAGTSSQQPHTYLAQVIYLPISGEIDSLTLQLSTTAAANQPVPDYLYNVNGGLPSSEILQLGTITPANTSVANHQYTISLAASTLAANFITPGDYAIVAYDPSTSTVGLDSTATQAPDFLGGSYSSNGSTWTSQPGYYALMSLDVTPVPEPIVESLLVFGGVYFLVYLGRWGWRHCKGTAPARDVASRFAG